MKKENFELSEKAKRALKEAREIPASKYIDLESLELVKNKKFMNSYRKAKQQISTREFDDWKKL